MQQEAAIKLKPCNEMFRAQATQRRKLQVAIYKMLTKPNSCASLAGFVACFIVVVMAVLVKQPAGEN